MTAERPRVELAQRALRDLRKMPAGERPRIRAALADLAAGAENLDVKALAGRAPWMRLRTGDWRVLYRPLAASEGDGWLVARVVNRRELERAVRALQE